MWRSDLVLRATLPGFARLEAPLVWNDDIGGKPGKFGLVVFPAGSLTDLGSTPQTLRRFAAFDPWKTGRLAAVGHDFLYARGAWPDGRRVTRETADEFLRVAIIAEGYSAFVARSWWLGVRSCGWLPWGRYRAADRDYYASAGESDDSP